MKVMRLMVVLASAIGVCAMIIAPGVTAHSTTNFKIMIFPLECSIDLLSTGVNTITQLTPENCNDPAPELPVDQSDTELSPLRPSGEAVRIVPPVGGSALPIMQGPAVTVPNENYDVISGNADHKSAHNAHVAPSPSKGLTMTTVIGSLLPLSVVSVLVWRRYTHWKGGL